MYRDDFPILQQVKKGQPLVFLDSAASAQKPWSVIDAVSAFYREDYANIHRGAYDLSERATSRFEAVRDQVADFIGARTREEILFVHSATEGINLVAYSLGQFYFSPGDEILITDMEHHANIVPWQVLAQQRALVLKSIKVTDQGELDQAHYRSLLNSRTKLVALTHVSNVLGTVNPIQEMVKAAQAVGAAVLIDGAQAVPHFAVNMQDLGVDFYVFAGHKCYGPPGASVLYAKTAWLDRMPPYQTGGGMISEVTLERTTYLPAPERFEAGTPDIVGVIGLGAALAYLQNIGMPAVEEQERGLLPIALQALRTVPGIQLFGTAGNRIGVIAFTHERIHAHDLGTVLNEAHVAVRVGHHCAMPLHHRFGLPATVRASLSIYNTVRDIEVLVDALHKAVHFFEGVA